MITPPSALSSHRERVLLRRGFALEYVTLGWNLVGIVVLTVAVLATGSVALGGFGLDSLIEIGASTVVIWELSGTGEARQKMALRLIGGAFALLAAYLLVQSTIALVVGHRPEHGALGITWTAVTAAVMFALAAAKARTGTALGNPVLVTEGRVTFVDGLLATAVLAGVTLDTTLGWWWADPPRRLRHRLLRRPRGPRLPAILSALSPTRQSEVVLAPLWAPSVARRRRHGRVMLV